MKREKLVEFLSQMTLEEKLGQLTQTTGEHFLPAGEFSDELVETGPSMEDLGFTDENIHTVGSVLGVSGAKAVNAIQAAYLAKSRLKIPLLFMHDAIHGYRTIFPIPLALASSFDESLLEKVAEATAEELRISGIHVDFSPMTDLVRDARWGRVMESSGEDALLTGRLGAAMVRGYQNPEHYVAACVKHFAAYGAPDAGRDYASTDMSMKEFYGFYARTYELALQAAPDFVMSSFNSLNGEPATASRWLLSDILRGRFGFEGLVISDWGAVAELKNHGVAATDSEAGRLALSAGVEIEMLSNSYLVHGADWIKVQPELLAQIDAAVLKQLELKNKLGLFEQPFVDESAEARVIRSERLVNLSKEAAKRSCVLLKNEQNILPLPKTAPVLIIGPFAKTRKLLGSWQCKGRYDETVNIEAGFAAAGVKVVEAYETLAEVPSQVLAAFDTVLVTIGEGWHKSGEGHSSVNLELDSDQQALIHDLKGLGKKVVALGFAGRPMALESVVGELDALLWTWYLGNEAGSAIAELILGLDSPSGRLPMSFPRVSAQVPLRYNELRSGRPANDSSYSSRYQDLAVGPLFPFGFGLTYGEVVRGASSLSKAEIKAGESVMLSFDIENRSDYALHESVLLFMEDPVSALVRPVRELLDFKKVKLAKGEKKQVTFEITYEALTYLNNQGEKHLESGDINFYVNDFTRKVATLKVTSRDEKN